MDAMHFDNLARSLVTGASRRDIASALGTLALTLPFASLLGFTRAEAKKKKGKGKKKNKKKCKGDTRNCGKKCVAVQSDPRNCGSCGHECATGESCASGQCRGGEKCPTGLTRCGGDCVNTQTDEQHCGGCDNACANGQTCSGGECATSTCGPGQRDCGGGLCIEKDTDACCNQADCGGSGGDLVCNAAHRCVCDPSGLKADWGICQRFDNGAGMCGPCCPGGRGLGANCGPSGVEGDAICVAETIDGCDCSPSAPEACPSRAFHCSADLDRDPRRCGPNCQDCALLGPAVNCCGGQCMNGCQAGFGGCTFSPCGPNCVPCTEEAPLCCATDDPNIISICVNTLSCPHRA
jgi:hypothetical protein